MDDNTTPKMIFHPIIPSVQKFVLYETQSYFYLIGSYRLLRFRVLQIDRREPRELVVVDDKKEYTMDEIKEFIHEMSLGNRIRKRLNYVGGLPMVVSTFGLVGSNNKETSTNISEESEQHQSEKPVHKPTKTKFNWKNVWQRETFPRVVSAFGLLGFVRFMEGYYIILITKRRPVAVIGHHSIYKIEDTSMIYIPKDTVRLFHPDEQRYVKMFQSIDLSSNFYFSYSYDLTHTLQYNMAPPKQIKIDIPNNTNQNMDDDIEEAEDFFNMWKPHKNSQNESIKEKYVDYAIRTNPHRRFVWNSHLLAPIEKDVHRDWILYVIHGFIGQSNVSIFGRSVYIALIARRSNKYAGTRFLKRGANFDGDVANEVETEQIVHDSGVSSLNNGRFSSFVQMRGSVPVHWSQDVSKMVPKPTIVCDLADPYVETAGAHFNELLKRYGSPIIILNLVKKREKKKHESILSEELSTAVKYLNQFLPPEHHIQYISFDMARMNKRKEVNVMGRLANIAHNAVLKTGVFQSRKPYYSQRNLFSQQHNNTKKVHKTNSSSGLSSSSYDVRSSVNNSLKAEQNNYLNNYPSENETIEGNKINNVEYVEDHVRDHVREFFARKGIPQTGIIRTNCVDCLDRTNTAQFAIGKCALGFQLCTLGILESPKLEFDSDCVRMLEELYEDHGDTLALQYGGSQLVHRIETYRKTAPWTSQGNDIMQTLSRYYSNTFSDQEKQHTINLFLGLFIPQERKPSIWELPTDYYLHHKPACKYLRKGRLLTQWWDKNVLKCLPYAFNEVTKTCSEMIQVQSTTEEMIDIYSDYHRSNELSSLLDLYAYKINHSVRDFMPHFTTNFSPFAVRIRPGRRREETGSKNLNMKNPSLTGQSSTSSTTSSASSSEDSTSDEDESHPQMNDSQLLASKDSSELMSFKLLFPSMKEVYGSQPECPSRNDNILYRRFVLIGRNAMYLTDPTKLRSKLMQQASFPENPPPLAATSLPVVKDTSINVYKQYVNRAKVGGSIPKSNDINLYKTYANQEQLLSMLVRTT